MAIDTESKRRASLGDLPKPSGSSTAGSRGQVVGDYAGWLATPAAVVTGSPMVSQLCAIEVLTDYPCNGGVRKASIPWKECVVEITIENGVVVARVTVVTPANVWQRAQILPRRVFQLVYRDGAMNVSYEWFRIQDDQAASNAGGLATFRGHGPILDLAKKNLAITKNVNGLAQFAFTESSRSPAQMMIERVLPAGPSYFSLGVVTPTALQDSRFDSDNALSGAIKILQDANRSASTSLTSEYWLSCRANGLLGFFLDITIYNITATRPKIVTGRSLQGTERLKSSVPQANRVLMRGEGGATIGDNAWLVESVPNGTHIRIQDINGGRGPSNETDQLKNLCWVEENDTKHPITGSTKISDSITELLMAASAPIVAGDWGRIALNSAGDELVYLDTPSKQTTEILYVPLDVPDFDRYINIMKGPDLNEVAGVDPRYWSRLGVAPTQKTGIGEWLYGGKSWELNATILEQIRNRNVREDGVAWYTFWLYYTVANPTIEFQYEGISLPGSPWTMTQANGFTPSAWFPWTQSVPIAKGNRQFRMKLDANGGIVRLGAAQLLLGPANVDLSTRPFRRGAHPSAAWQVGMNYMAAYSDPVPSYRLRTLDYCRQFPSRYASDQFQFGGLVDGVDVELGETFTQRITRLRMNMSVPLDSELDLGPREASLVQRLAGRG